MKITFFSNYLNHLQTPFCDELFKVLGNNFRFVSTQKLPEERLLSGYENCTDYIYNINSYLDDKSYAEAINLGFISDIVIIGSAPEIFIAERLKYNKITLRYGERFLKKGKWQLLDPRVIYNLYNKHTKYRRSNLYLLCASAFTSIDANKVYAYPNKKLKWGYFTQVDNIEIDEIVANKPVDKIEIIWTGRFINWKHPEMAIQLANVLKSKKYNFHLTMIGAGTLSEDIKRSILKLKLSDYVSYLGSLNNSEVKDHMLQSNIFIFTSDRNEGWGVVLNEAMSCGCSVVAGDKIGSVPYLIKNNENGLIFKSKNINDLVQKTESLINNREERERLGKAAYDTLLNHWNPKIASKNFLVLSESLLIENKPPIIKNGPCSLI